MAGEFVSAPMRRSFGSADLIRIAEGAVCLSDAELIERIRFGDEATRDRAFQRIVQRHGPLVDRICRTLLDEHEAHDAFQATFLVLATRPGSVRRGASLAAWLHGTAVRVASAARRRHARRTRHERIVVETADASSDRESSWERWIERRDLAFLVQREVAALPRELNQVVVLCYLQGLTHDRAADLLGWPVGTVRTRLSRARARLKVGLERRGIGPDALAGLPMLGVGMAGSGASSCATRLVLSTTLAASTVRSGALVTAHGLTASGTVATFVSQAVWSPWMISLKAIAATLLASATLVLATGDGLVAQDDPPVLVNPKGDAVDPPAEPVAEAATDSPAIIVRTYDVGDLVASQEYDKDAPALDDDPLIAKASTLDAKPLIALLTRHIARGTWSVRYATNVGESEIATTIVTAPNLPQPERGVQGTLTFQRPELQLKVEHTLEVHDDIAHLLKELRRVVALADRDEPPQGETPLEEATTPSIGPELLEKIEFCEQRIAELSVKLEAYRPHYDALRKQIEPLERREMLIKRARTKFFELPQVALLEHERTRNWIQLELLRESTNDPGDARLEYFQQQIDETIQELKDLWAKQYPQLPFGKELSTKVNSLKKELYAF